MFLLKELNIEKQKYNGLLRKFEHDNGHSTEQLRHELVSTEKVTIEQRQYYTRQIDHLEKEKAELKNELDNLRDVLKDLHEQLSKYTFLFLSMYISREFFPFKIIRAAIHKIE